MQKALDIEVDSKNGTYSVPALERTIKVLDTLGRHPRGLSLPELVSATGIPKSSLFRIIATLLRHSVVVKDKDRQVYCLGMRLYEWGSMALDRLDFKAVVHPFLTKLASETGQSFYLAVLEDYEVILIDRADTPDIWRIVTRIGLRSPVHCTASGLALISEFSEAQLDDLVQKKGLKKFTSKTIATKDELIEKLKRVRKLGYAVADGDFKPDLFALAVPLKNHNGEIIASLMAGLHIETAHRDGKFVRSLITTLLKTGREISRTLGYK
ncbi:MAG: IclR family transcriptional regulator, partial [Candidatus Kryptoniota bacterium]